MKNRYTLPILLLGLVILSAGIVVAGGLVYRSRQDRFQTEIQHKLAASVDLEASELSMERNDCLADAGIFYQNSTVLGLTVLFVVALLFGAAAAVGFFWWKRRSRIDRTDVRG